MEKYDVIIVGAGLGGVQMGIRLKMCGMNNFVILEKNDGVGGTWYLNNYPGLTCDVNSWMMNYSHQTKHANFPEYFSAPSRFCENINAVVDSFDLRKHIKFGYTVDVAEWHDDKGIWTVNKDFSCKVSRLS